MLLLGLLQMDLMKHFSIEVPSFQMTSLCQVGIRLAGSTWQSASKSKFANMTFTTCTLNQRCWNCCGLSALHSLCFVKAVCAVVATGTEVDVSYHAVLL